MAYYNEGRYLVEVTGQGFGESDQKKTPFFFLEFEPRYQMMNQGQVGVEPYTREVRLYLTDKALDGALARLRSLGWSGTSFSELEPGGAFSFSGQEMGLICQHSQDGDKVYENWSVPLAGGGSKVESKSGISKKLDNLFGRQLRKTGKVESDSAPRPVENQTVPDEEDDIPF